MKLKEFLKDRFSYIVAYFAGIGIVSLILYLGLIPYNPNAAGKNALYALLLGMVFLGIFLFYDYTKNRGFAKQLELLLTGEDLNGIANITAGRTLEQKKYSTLLMRIYRLHKNKLNKYEESQKQYIYFINQWVHQMKTPVSVTDLLLQEPTEECREVFESLREENEKLSQGLDMMLNHARLHEFNVDFKVENLDLVELVRKLINDSKKLLIRSAVFPKITGAESCFVETDKKWIAFTINQILNNAVKYSRLGAGEQKYITFEIKEQSETVTLSVTDQGIGIPKEDLGRVFQPFFTGKNGRKTSEATGMGMYLAKTICDHLGHQLLAASEEGAGATFTIVFHRGKSIFRL